LVDVPVWAFHSSSDYGSPVAGVRSTVAALQAAGGRAHVTEVESFAGHDCWTAAFKDYYLLSWLLSQKRGDASGRGPGTLTVRQELYKAWQGWSAGQMLGQIGIPLLVVLAIWSARRQRRLRRSREPSGTSSS
jgi:hypothetical protein